MKITVFYNVTPCSLVLCIGINMSEGEYINNLRNVGTSLRKCIEVNVNKNPTKCNSPSNMARSGHVGK